MIENLLKPIKWFDFDDIHGNKTSTTATIICEYDVEASESGYEVNYYNRQTEAPSKTATGFKTVEEAKQWAWEHYIEKMTPYLNADPLTETVNWFKEAKPEPTIEDECVQQGVMFEEVYELLDALGLSESDAGRGLKHLAYLFKTKQPYAIKLLANLTNEQHIERLDAMCDIVVTAAGSSYTNKDDFISALKEVNASNWSKFENGKAVTDENGKIVKGEGYFKPQLDRFVGGSDE